MSKHGKAYKKALDYYYKGHIEKAINECEKGLALYQDNSGSFLNLKGLLFYFKGDLEEAKKTWKINANINNDEVAKKYLEDSKNDAERKVKYQEAEEAFRSMNIDECLELLSSCKESDFNCINVNVKLAECYMKKAEYDKVIEFVNQVLVIDKFNTEALSLKTELINLEVIKKEKDYELLGKIGIAAAGVGLIAILCISMAKALDFNPITGKPVEVIGSNDKNNGTTNKVEDKEDDDTDKKEEMEEKVKEIFPKDEIKTAIKEKKYDKLCEYISTWNEEELAEDEKSILDQAIVLMDDDGIEEIYLRGYGEYEKGNYDKAISEFEKVKSLNRLEQPYNQSNMFFLATSYDKLGQFDKAVEIYDEFIATYKTSDYRAEIVYTLAVKFKDNNNMEKAKEYANIIKNEYPSMIYYNDIIKEILK